MQCQCLKQRQSEQGQALIIVAMGIFVLTLVFFFVLDVGLLEAAEQRLTGEAEATARAGVEGATLLGGYGSGGSAPHLDPVRAEAQATAYFQALGLSGVSLDLTATPTLLTARLSTSAQIFFWPGPVALSATASETPQASTAIHRLSASPEAVRELRGATSSGRARRRGCSSSRHHGAQQASNYLACCTL